MYDRESSNLRKTTQAVRILWRRGATIKVENHSSRMKLYCRRMLNVECLWQVGKMGEAKPSWAWEREKRIFQVGKWTFQLSLQILWRTKKTLGIFWNHHRLSRVPREEMRNENIFSKKFVQLSQKKSKKFHPKNLDYFQVSAKVRFA